MHSLRIRVVKLSSQFGAGESNLYAIQISQDGLLWWTLRRDDSFDAAKAAADAFVEFAKANQLVKPTHILWQTRL